MSLLLLAGPLVAVTAWCLARLVVPRLRSTGCGPAGGSALGSWHVVMGASMAGMVLWSMAPAAAGAVAALFVVGAAWSLLRLRRRPAATGARGAHARLALGSAAMVAMTLPMAAPASAAGGMAHHQHASAGAALAPPDALVLLLLVGLAATLLGRLGAALRPSRAGVARLDAGCDAVMAGAMAWMLVLTLPG